MELEIEAHQAELEAAGEGIGLTGLYQGIDEVNSNVTYTNSQIKLVGTRNMPSGRISL